MSVEVSVFSPNPPLSEFDLRRRAKAKGLAVRLLGPEGDPRDALPSGPVIGHFIAVGWPSSDTATPLDVDAAIAGKNKDAIDALGKANRIGWCELGAGPFDYEAFWAEYADEREEYEASFEPDRLAAIKASRIRYALRSAVRPVQCGQLVDQLVAVLKDATQGVTE